MKNINLCLCMICFFGSLSAQQNTAQMFHWPTVAPDGTVRTSGTQTSEDWWYDLKRIPSNHPAYSGQNKFVACGYSIYSGVTYYNHLPGVPFLYHAGVEPCTTSMNLRDMYADINDCELEFVGYEHATVGIGTLGFVDPNDPSYTNSHTYSYLSGETKKVIPTSDGGFLACGWSKNLFIPTPVVPAPNIPSTLQGTPIPYYNSGYVNGNPPQPLFMDNTCCTGNEFAAQAFVMKTDSNGVLQWARHYGPDTITTCSGEDGIFDAFGRISDMIEKPDGTGYYILGGKWVVFMADIGLDGVPRWIKQVSQRNNSNPPLNPGSGWNNVGWMDMELKVEQNGSHSLYTVGESGGAVSTLCKFNIVNGMPTLVGRHRFTTPNRVNQTDRCGSIEFMQDGRLAVAWVSDCQTNSANADCSYTYVSYFSEFNGIFTEDQRIPLGPSVSYDMFPGLSLAPLASGGVAVLGMKKLFHSQINPPQVLQDRIDYSRCNQDYPSYFTDAFVAKIKPNGDLEWTTTFDAWSASPAPNDPNTAAGDPTNQTNVNNWINAGVYDGNGNLLSNDNFRYDIRKEECLYRLTTDEQGRLLAVGNNGANLDDSYIAVVENTCNLVLNNHVIQRINRWMCQPYPQQCQFGTTTYAPEYIATNITLGRETGNTAELARFKVELDANVKITAGTQVTMKSGTSLKPGTNGSVSVKLNPAHTCTAGPVYSLD